MAKDPAFLFYPGDVLQEISLMNNIQKGIYLSLICYLHKNICISYEQLMSFTTGTNEQDKHVIISAMKQDEAGKYYIEWLKNETERRKAYSESRAKNRKTVGKSTIPKDKKRNKRHDKHMKDISERYEQHMETETEDKTEDKNQNELGGVGEKQKSLHVQMREFFCEEYKRATGLTYDFNGVDGKKINELQNSIRVTIRDKIDGFTDDDVLDTFKILIKNLPQWYRKNAFDLKTIAGNYSKIIGQLNVKNNGTNFSQFDQEITERVARGGNPYA